MNNTLNNTLKPCPFCGGEAGIKTATTSHASTAIVYCKECNAKSAEFHDSKRDGTFLFNAIDAWNRRAGEEKNNG